MIIVPFGESAAFRAGPYGETALYDRSVYGVKLLWTTL